MYIYAIFLYMHAHNQIQTWKARHTNATDLQLFFIVPMWLFSIFVFVFSFVFVVFVHVVFLCVFLGVPSILM